MYIYDQKKNVHVERGRKILTQYPQVRELFGHNPFSGLAIAMIVAGQITLAAYLSLQEHGFLTILIVSLLIGAFANHALYSLIHECTHNLVGKGTVANRWWGILCDFALVIPSAMGFRHYHLLHHRHLGEYDFDPDLVSHGEAKLVGNSRLKKALWMTFFFISQGVFRPMRLNKNVKFWGKWPLINLLVQLLVNFLIFHFFGFQALLYLFLSTFWALGPHPLGGRWIQEHYLTVNGQETYSYYGPLNIFTFNIGYHNEHHDLAMVPWNRLPRLKKMCPEFYDGLHSYSSLTAVLWNFIWNKKMSPYSRIVHEIPKIDSKLKYNPSVDSKHNQPPHEVAFADS